MAVGLYVPTQLYPVHGIKLASCHSGIKTDESVDDLVLVELNKGSTVAAVFTTNKFCAAPVTIARQHLHSSSSTRYLLINSGNANAGTGTQGLDNTLKSCQLVADLMQTESSEVLPFSTGVIGQQLPVDLIVSALPGLSEQLNEDNWLAAAQGIMTTDTLPKAVSTQFKVEGKTVTITGMCKGSGMIKPDMATMLAYVATDARISSEEINICLQMAVNESFNSITVDGDTSTNDACVLMASGYSRVEVGSHHEQFMQQLLDVFKKLAQSIIRDGEGASKFVEIKVQGATSDQDARELAYTIAHSPLVKTALFASDANWGRILAAIGRAPITTLDIEKVDLFLGNVCLVRNGVPDKDYTEEKGQQVMSEQEILIQVALNLGAGSATVWTTDLSYEYVKINAEYRS